MTAREQGTGNGKQGRTNDLPAHEDRHGRQPKEKRRHLVSMRRSVRRERCEEYDAAWERLRQSAEAGGAHAWRFISAERDDLYLEFLEFAAGADPRKSAETAAALHTLDAVCDVTAVDTTEEWREVPEPVTPLQPGR